MTVHPKEPEFCQQYTKQKLLSPGNRTSRAQVPARITGMAARAGFWVQCEEAAGVAR